MRPLTHPALEDITVEGILYAFSDPVRIQIYADIARAECPQSCSVFLIVKEAKLPKSTLSQHFKILRESGLIRSKRVGVEMLNSTRCAEIRGKFGNLISSILEAYQIQDKAKKKSKLKSRK